MIKISVVRATIIRNTRMVSTMDPFCKVTYGEHSELTEVATDAGKKPEWDAKFEFPYDPEIVSCVFLVYDKDGSKDIFVSCFSPSSRWATTPSTSPTSSRSPSPTKSTSISPALTMANSSSKPGSTSPRKKRSSLLKST